MLNVRFSFSSISHFPLLFRSNSVLHLSFFPIFLFQYYLFIFFSRSCLLSENVFLSPFLFISLTLYLSISIPHYLSIFLSICLFCLVVIYLNIPLNLKILFPKLSILDCFKIQILEFLSRIVFLNSYIFGLCV